MTFSDLYTIGIIVIILAVVFGVRAIFKSRTFVGDLVNVVWYIIKTYWWIPVVAAIAYGMFVAGGGWPF